MRSLLLAVLLIFVVIFGLIVSALFEVPFGGTPSKLAGNPTFEWTCVNNVDEFVADIKLTSSDYGQSAILERDGVALVLPYLGATLFGEEIYQKGNAKLILEMENHVHNVFGEISGICQ